MTGSARTPDPLAYVVDPPVEHGPQTQPDAEAGYCTECDAPMPCRALLYAENARLDAALLEANRQTQAALAELQRAVENLPYMTPATAAVWRALRALSPTLPSHPEADSS